MSQEHEHETESLILEVGEAATSIRIHRATFYAIHKKDPKFPRIFKIGGRKSGVLAAELRAWVLAQHASTQIRPAGGEGGAA